MGIEGGDQRSLGSQQFSQAGKHVPIGIKGPFGDGRPMGRRQNSIQRTCRLALLDHHRDQFFECRGVDWAVRDRTSSKNGDHFDLIRSVQAGEKAANFVRGVGKSVANRISTQQRILLKMRKSCIL